MKQHRLGGYYYGEDIQLYTLKPVLLLRSNTDLGATFTRTIFAYILLIQYYFYVAAPTWGLVLQGLPKH